jgi:hypothetical protein
MSWRRRLREPIDGVFLTLALLGAAARAVLWLFGGGRG